MRMNKFFLLDDDDICFDPDQHAEFDFYRASALEQHHTCIFQKKKICKQAHKRGYKT
jgi:hypothetical protein